MNTPTKSVSPQGPTDIKANARIIAQAIGGRDLSSEFDKLLNYPRTSSNNYA